jgi:hypothetical protein
MKRFVMVILLTGCSPPPAPEPVKVPEPVVAAVTTPAPAPTPAPETVKAAAKKKVRVTEETCQDLNAPYIQCGYRCTRSHRSVSQCMSICKPALSKEYGLKCVRNFGPGFM